MNIQNTSNATPPFGLLTSKRCVEDRFLSITNQPDLTLISGVAGSGKTLRAIDLILNQLRQGGSVHVFDVGYSYEKLCRLVGGTYTEVSETESIETIHGNSPLFVYDFLKTSHAGPKIKAAELSIHDDEISGTLLVVDELDSLAHLIPDLKTYIENHIESQGSTVLINQDRTPDVGLLHAFSAGNRVRRTLVTLSNH